MPEKTFISASSPDALPISFLGTTEADVIQEHSAFSSSFEVRSPTTERTQPHWEVLGDEDDYFFEKVAGIVKPLTADLLVELDRLGNIPDSESGDYIALLQQVGIALDNEEIAHYIDYETSPSESAVFSYLMANAFVPALEAVEARYTSDVGESRLQAVRNLMEYADTWSLGFADAEGFADAAETTLALEVYTTCFALCKSDAERVLVLDHLESRMAAAPAGSLEAYQFDSFYYYDHLPDVSPESHCVANSVLSFITQTQFENPTIPAEFVSRNLVSFEDAQIGSIVDSLSEIGVSAAVPSLVTNLRSEDIGLRRLSAEILYRLELGKIGVTEDGVNYLGKLYDLGSHNDPDFFVRRLNTSGLIGVLAEDGGNLEGVFPLDLYAEEAVVHAEVRQLVSQELFLPKADESLADRQQREHYLQLFVENYEGLCNSDFFSNTGVRLNSLDLHEQGWFLLHYLEITQHEESVADIELTELQDFVRDFGEYGLKSFLALEYGGSGQEILGFARDESLTKEEKITVFESFYSIANEAMRWRDIFGELEPGVGHEFAPQIHEAFIRKNAEFLTAAQIIARGEGGDVTMSELVAQMRSIAFSLHALKGVYGEGVGMQLEQNPQYQAEYDVSGQLIEGASSSHILVDEALGARVVVSIRPQPTVREGNRSGGESRINFGVTNLKTGERVRIGFDRSDYGEYIGEVDKPPVVSLDFGVGKPDRASGIWPSMRVGRVLELVEGSEGGHNELSFGLEAAAYFPTVAETFRNHMERRFVEAEAL
jgi:hypothetical protein